MVKAESHVVWDQYNTEGPKGPPFVLLAVPQLKVGRSRFVGSEHRSRVIFCFDIHSNRGQPRTPHNGDNLGVLYYHLNPLMLTEAKNDRTILMKSFILKHNWQKNLKEKY